MLFILSFLVSSLHLGHFEIQMLLVFMELLLATEHLNIYGCYCVLGI